MMWVMAVLYAHHPAAWHFDWAFLSRGLYVVERGGSMIFEIISQRHEQLPSSLARQCSSRVLYSLLFSDKMWVSVSINTNIRSTVLTAAKKWPNYTLMRFLCMQMKLVWVHDIVSESCLFYSVFTSSLSALNGLAIKNQTTFPILWLKYSFN